MKTIIRIAIAAVTLSLGAADLFAQSGPYQYIPLTPCRVVDTRNPVGTNGGPALTTAARDFAIRGNCGVPVGAKAVAVNITVTSASTSSWLTIWPSGQSKPFVSTINFDSTTTALANGAVIGVSANTQDLSVANAAGTVHMIIDVSGYYQ
jgi:hypothetical protein